MTGELDMATRTRKITQRELANRLGLSQMTVSYALRGSEMVSRQTREHVQKEAARLGYRPNSSAQAMRNGRFGCVAIVDSTEVDRSSYFGGDLIGGVHDALLSRDTHLTIARLPDAELTDENFMPKILRQLMVDGMLINYFAQIPNRLVELVEEYNLPAIWLNSKQARDCIYPDDHQAGRHAVQHLMELGHRKIGYLDHMSDRPEHFDPTTHVHYSVLDRFNGYCDAMRDAALPVRDFLGSHMRMWDDPLAVVTRWIRQPDRPTALICHDRRVVTQIIHAALTHGLSVPGDLSVITFEDINKCEMGMTMTTMRQCWEDFGRTAAGVLMDKIKANNQSMPAMSLPYKLELGQTTAVCPG
ncbi:MAG: hypothetical protein CMJ19_14435 [Phycisphaeraceae bacterium]|nr:hypothetical protein [Phycisphaeraceae bacterium]